LDFPREDSPYWNEAVETMPYEKVRELQLTKVKRQVNYNYDNSIFYRRKFDQAGIKPEDIKSWKDFTSIPLMNKEEQRKAQTESLERFGNPYGIITCAPLNKIIRISSTSGTTGTPTLYTLTKNDTKIITELHARKNWRMGLKPGHVVLHALALSMFTGGVPVIDAMQEYGLCVVPVGAEAKTRKILEFIELTKPYALKCTPSLAEHMIEQAPKIIGKEVGDLGIKLVSCGGEPGVGIPAVKKRIEEAYGAKLYDNIGGAHTFHGISCRDGVYRGMHLVSPDYCVLELVDPETKSPIEITDGAIGEMVFTFLDWEGGPFLRYDLGDMLQVFTKPCECGWPDIRFKIIGRADDMLIVKGVNIYPMAIKNFVASFMPRTTGAVRILLDKPGHRVTPPLKLKVEYDQAVSESELPLLKKEMEQLMSDIHRIRSDITFVPPYSLERESHKTKLIEVVSS